MSIRVQLVCDVCDRDFGSVDGVNEDAIVTMRNEAESMGWHRVRVSSGKWDACPSCHGRIGSAGVKTVYGERALAAAVARKKGA